MRRRSLLKLLGAIVLAVVIAIAFMPGCAKEAPAPAPTPKPEPIVLEIVTFVSAPHPWFDLFMDFVDEVNKQAKGELIIEYVGGREVIGAFELAGAVKRGVIDIALLPDSFYEGLMPEAALGNSVITMQEERENGFLDFYRELHEEAGLYFLGRSIPNDGPAYYLYTNKPVQTLQDLDGFKIATEWLLVSALPDLGMIPASIPDTEVYMALDRGVVDGFTGTLQGCVPQSFDEVLTHLIDHPFIAPNIGIIINLDVWESLPKHLQDLMEDVQIATVEGSHIQRQREFVAYHREILRDTGMVFVEFSPADEERWNGIILGSLWEALIEKSPEHGSRLKELLTKSE